MSRVSSQIAGLENYTVKRDWRRDLDQEIRREGYDYLWPNVSGDFATDPGEQPFPWLASSVPTQEPITLIFTARRPNGETALIAGTQTKLFRFFTVKNTADYFDTDYFEPEPAANAPYYNDNPGLWMEIGSGFSEDGNRWEAVNINGYAVFNNGVDLPVTYRLEDTEVSPIYELREQGVASVGTIAEYYGILMCSDISEIQTTKLAELLTPKGETSSGEVTATQSGFTITSSVPFFSSDMVGKTITLSGQTAVNITAVSAPVAPETLSTSVTVDGTATVSSPKQFTIRTKASQAGATWSGTVSGTISSGSFSVEASGGTLFTGSVGKVIRFINGFSAEITAVADATHATLDTAPTSDISGTPFYITTSDGGSAFEVVAASDFFDSSMVGLKLLWDTGEERTIISVTDATTVVVDSDGPISSGLFKIENDESWAAFTDANYIDRTQYKVIWSMENEPRRFGAVVNGNILSGSKSITLDYTIKSFEVGDEIRISGAGVNGGNLTATITAISYLNRVLLLDTAASTRVIGAAAQQTDSIGSIVGSYELQDDGSGILKMLALGSALIVYKDTGIYIGSYTGDAAAPFAFTRLQIPDSRSLYYRHTLINVSGLYHVYAGSGSFYKFDLTNRIPEIVQEMEVCSDLFFNEATLENTESIFAVENGITSEAWFVFPSTSSDKAICLDYKYGTVSTTGMEVTAAAMVKKPETGVVVGSTEDWFVLGTEDGVLVQYGKADAEQAQWSDDKEIYYRRSAYPFDETKTGYASALYTGMGNFGDDFNEKDVMEHVFYLASTPESNCQIALAFYGSRNVAETATSLLSKTVTTPKSKNLTSFFFRKMYFQERYTISGYDNPCRITARTWRGNGLDSRSNIRR